MALLMLLAWDLSRFYKCPPWNGVFLPYAAAVFGYIMVRSTLKTLRQGGIVWRGTKYTLEDLRRGKHGPDIQ